jgi:prepilin-type N-terminal cleavage/methylation domain-containing protein
MKHAGFTLIEVLLAIVILAVLSALTAGSIQRSLKVKAKIQYDIDRESVLRNAFRLMTKDIKTAFHFRNINQELKEEMAKAAAAVPPPAGAPPPPPPDPTQVNPDDVPPKQLTQFIGDEESLHFTSLNHIRMMQDSKESDQEEVGYFVETCKGRSEESKSSKCLLRRTSAIIDDDVTKGGSAIVLLENIQTFKMKYLGKGKDDWVTVWKTDEKGDDVTKNNFPQAVEVTLITKDNEREFGISSVIPIQFPNNKVEKKSEALPAGSVPPPNTPDQ